MSDKQVLSVAANAVPIVPIKGIKGQNEVLFHQFFSDREWEDITRVMSRCRLVKEFAIAPCCDIRCDLLVVPCQQTSN